MSWLESRTKNRTGSLYANVSLEGNTALAPSILELGKAWIKSRHKQSLYLSGSPGSGKTYFCLCLVRSLAEKGNPWHIFGRSHEMDSEFLKATLENQEETVLDKYKSVPYLFIDDLGIERPNERIIKQYYSIFEHRVSNCMCTIVTSNQKLDDIHKILGDRIASRLQGSFEINFPNKDLRKTRINHD